MHNRSLRFVLALALGVASASMMGCGSSGGGGNDTGTGGNDSGTGNDGTAGNDGTGGNDGTAGNDGTGGNDGTAGNDGSANTDGGTTGDQCTTFGNAICDRLNTCVPVLIQFQYGTVADCKAAVQISCTSSGMPAGSQGLNDPNACLSAISGGTCSDFLNAIQNSPMACREKPGTVAENGACGYDSQCAAGLGCGLFGASFPDPRCMQGQCVSFIGTGSSCDTGRTDECESRIGNTCVETFSASASSGSDGNPVCQPVVYGGANADCTAGTNKQCGAGFYCASNHHCAPLSGQNSDCVQGSDHCDSSQGLACQPATTGTGSVCSPLTFVPEGSQCDLVSGQYRFCLGNLYCDRTGTTPTCRAKKTQGQGCVTTPTDNCALGLHCAGSTEPMPGTCQPPQPPVCS